MPLKFIRISGKNVTVRQLEKEARAEAKRNAQQRIFETVDAIKAELEAIIEDVIANTASPFPNYRTEPGFKGLSVKVIKKSNDRYEIVVVDENGSRSNAFNWQDAGAKSRKVKTPTIFARYDGDIISRGEQSAIKINRSNKKFDGSVVRLFPRSKFTTVRYARSFTIKARKPKNLYNRAIITLKNQKTAFFTISGTKREYVFRYVPRSGKSDVLFDSKLFSVKVVTK